MDDRLIRSSGAWAAYATALASFAYTVALVLVPETDDPVMAARAAVAGRAMVEPANWLLASLGLLGTLAVVAVAARVWPRQGGPGEPLAPWLAWGMGLGLIGMAMTAAHGFYDAVRVPVLLQQWELGDPARRAALAAFSGLPTPVDPKGLGTFLFVGLFVLVVSRVTALDAGGWSRGPMGTLGLIYALTLGLAFVLGLMDVDPALRAGTTGLAMGVVGPVWWLLAGRALASVPEGA